MRVFVTGAAGYIGSVVTERLIEKGHSVIAFDSLETGNREAVHPDAEFVLGDLRDRAGLTDALSHSKVEAVVHLAARSLVEESVIDPGLYFDVNVGGGLNLLSAMRLAHVSRIVFSSTASVYGEPEYVPIDEAHPKRPVNPYGESKLQFEQILSWFGRAYGLTHVSLRYFNACGATARYGEARKKETHILPILFQAALGQRERFSLFGTDYDTPDGSCVRDYVHVVDIADAHLLALQKMDAVMSKAYNIGIGQGFSNREIVEAVKAVSGRGFEVVGAPRRPGDPAKLLASNTHIGRELGWKPVHSDLQEMVRSAWEWSLAHPHGYDA